VQQVGDKKILFMYRLGNPQTSSS